MQSHNVAINSVEMTSKKVISVDEMAKSLSIAKTTAYQLTKIKDFPCFYIGKRIIIPVDLFYDWIKKQTADQSIILD